MNNPVNDFDVYYLANTLTSEQLRSDIERTREGTLRAKVFDTMPCSLLWSGPTPFFLDGTLSLFWLNSAGVEQALKEELFDYEWWLATLQAALRCQQANRPPPSPSDVRIDIQELKARNDIVETAERYTTLRKAGRNFVGCCPLHDEKHPSFTIYPDKQTWHCFGCGKGGDVIALIMAAENIDFRGAAVALGAR